MPNVSFGYNVIELNQDYGPTTGYFDDIAFGITPIPEPSGLALMACGLAVVWRRTRRTK